MGGAAVAIILLATTGAAYWPSFPLIVAAALTSVALLERIVPYEPAWNRSHGDLLADVFHNGANHALIQLTVASTFLLRAVWAPEPTLWPSHWPIWAQVLAAGATLDLSLYAMHRWSHVNGFLWRLHAIHHSAERLYWLNSERRHPVSALLLAGPGFIALLALGAPAEAVSAWFAILTIHLAFQHSNLDYRVGPLKWLLGVAEVHRWHHKREYEDAQVNFGEFWMIWDHLFRSFHLARTPPRAGEVGLRDRSFPQHYPEQFMWPFRRASEGE
jgi:sterol desaturase/sphingolipid hydroxylase (fatty acid hydroxylase superfamily)